MFGRHHHQRQIFANMLSSSLIFASRRHSWLRRSPWVWPVRSLPSRGNIWIWRRSGRMKCHYLLPWNLPRSETSFSLSIRDTLKISLSPSLIKFDLWTGANRLKKHLIDSKNRRKYPRLPKPVGVRPRNPTRITLWTRARLKSANMGRFFRAAIRKRRSYSTTIASKTPQ